MTTAPRSIGLKTAIKRILKVFSSFWISSFNSSLIESLPLINQISKFNYTKFENTFLIGISRKGFLKRLTKETNLDQTSVTTGIISLLNGAKIIRTHNVTLTATMIEEVFG